MTITWIDDNGDAAVGLALLELVRRIDARAGYPFVATNALTGVPDPDFVVRHLTRPHAHPTQSGRTAVPVDARVLTHLAIVKAACQNLVHAGVATALETKIAALPSPGALDATWSA